MKTGDYVKWNSSGGTAKGRIEHIMTEGVLGVMYSKQPEEVKQRKNRLIAFPSYMLHRVKPVVKGTRKSLVFWIIGPKFK